MIIVAQIDGRMRYIKQPSTNSNNIASNGLKQKGAFGKEPIHFSCPIIDGFRNALNVLFCWQDDDMKIIQNKPYENENLEKHSKRKRYPPIHSFFVFI